MRESDDEDDDLGPLAFRRRSSPGESFSTWFLWICFAVVVAFAAALFLRTSVIRHEASAASSTAIPSGAVSLRGGERRVASDTRSNALPVPRVPMVYRCVTKDGAVSLQSRRCAAGQHETRSVYAPPDVERPSAVVVPRAAAAVVSGYSLSQPPRDDERDHKRAACQRARATRESALAAVGLNRTYDLLQRLDSMVRDACKDV